MTTTSARLDAIEARADRLDYVIEYGSSDPLHATAVQDIPFLLTLARKQAAALEHVRVLADNAPTFAGFRDTGSVPVVAIRAALGDGDE